MLLSVMSQNGRIARWVGGVLLTLMIVGGAAASTMHQRTWRAAGETRDRVRATVASSSELRACGTVWIEGLPDNERGAYVFRNGADIAFQDFGVRVVSDAPPACRFTWDGTNMARAQ
jgi:hypothetical protein